MDVAERTQLLTNSHELDDVLQLLFSTPKGKLIQREEVPQKVKDKFHNLLLTTGFEFNKVVELINPEFILKILCTYIAYLEYKFIFLQGLLVIAKPEDLDPSKPNGIYGIICYLFEDSKILESYYTLVHEVIHVTLDEEFGIPMPLHYYFFEDMIQDASEDFVNMNLRFMRDLMKDPFKYVKVKVTLLFDDPPMYIQDLDTKLKES